MSRWQIAVRNIKRWFTRERWHILILVIVLLSLKPFAGWAINTEAMRDAQARSDAMDRECERKGGRVKQTQRDGRLCVIKDTP